MTDSRRLKVEAHCLMFFTDETGHEEFADPEYPVFGIGGCAVMAGALDAVIRRPWRAMKEAHFGGADFPLHASALRSPTPVQLDALGRFFRAQPFGRFAVTMTAYTEMPPEYEPYAFMPNLIRDRWEELASRAQPTPVEVAFVHEASDRGNALLEKYFGENTVRVNGQVIPAHHALIEKRQGDEALEVADFIVQAAGRQDHRWASGDMTFRRDFEAVFHANPLWSSFFRVRGIRRNEPPA